MMTPNSMAMRAERGQVRTQCEAVRRWSLVVGMAVLLGMVVGASAQTVHFRTAQLRQTVPVASSGSVVWSNYAVLTGVSEPVTVSVEGLPPGATATVNPTSLTASGAVLVTLQWDNVAEGEYPFRLQGAGGATNHLILTLQVAHIWNGQDQVQGQWSSPANWVGGQVPPEGADIVFSDLGGQTALFTNVVVDQDVTVGSLRFATTNTTRFHTLSIAPGRTLRVVGPLGLRLLRDYVSEWAGLGNGPTVTFVGPQAALVVSNEQAEIAITLDNQITHTVDLSALGVLVADVHRVGLADYASFPNYWNLLQNGYGGIPRRFVPNVYLARTNLIRARYTDPEDYQNPERRIFSMAYMRSGISGTTQIRDLYLGAYNEFYMESICFIGANQQGRVRFNPAFAGDNPVAIFRNLDGGRMKVFAVSDNSGPGSGVSNIKSWLYFGDNNGLVDILADLFYIARDRPLLNGDPNFQGQMFVGRGIVDVNRAVLGFQDGGTRTNSGVYRGYCQGTLVISNTAVFRVNEVLELGYNTETNPGGEPWNTWGRLFVGPGGTAMINRVEVGGPAGLSGDNQLVVTNGGHLILSNTVASPQKKLARLILNGGRLTLHADGARTEPYVYVTNFTATGTGNQIQLAEIRNLVQVPVEIPLIAYDTAAANLALELPAGFYGYLLDDPARKLVVAVVDTNPPPEVVWEGSVNGLWDQNTANWRGNARFLNGAPVVFDDTALGTTTVTVVGTVAPGPVLVTNQVKTYSFAGGTIAGTSQMTKRGSGTLIMDATSQLPLALEEGQVQGRGAVGTTTVGPAGVLNFAGTINGLISSGTVVSSGTIENGILIQGGSLESSGTINGPVTVAAGTARITGTVNAVGTSTVETGATLVLDGRFLNTTARLNINGTLTGEGVVSDPDGYNLGADGRLAINNGGVFAPGNGIGVFSVEGRFDLNPGARLVIEVDLNHPARHDVVAVDVFGNIRGIITMTNTGTVPFAVGQSFLIISNNFNLPNTPLNPNIDFRFEPESPGPGMRWDGSELATNGIVRIVAAPLEPPRMAVSLAGNQLTLSWPETHRGWILQQQVRSLTNGLSLDPADWVPVAGSQDTNRFTIQLSPEAEAVFYRLVQP
jgi:hypothetical protein